MTTMLSALLNRLQVHQRNALEGFNLTPSENRLSPLATLPFTLDPHSRYFQDDLRLFGQWCFPAGRQLGTIEREILHPLLKHFTRSRFINVRPISGINCTTIVLAALAKPGDRILIVPVGAGGHANTRQVATRLGAQPLDIPFSNAFDIDEAGLAALLHREKIRLIYLDQSALLFPIDPKPIRDIVDAVSPDTLIHYDSSEVCGLIFGSVLPNPLERGADSFGGSTHKTLPGPHKSFIATHSPQLARAIEATSNHFVSQHTMAGVVSLAITLLEFRDCGGDIYARRTVENAQAFANELAASGLHVAAQAASFTACHQVWVAAEPSTSAAAQSYRLEQAGILANPLPSLPTVRTSAFRLSTAVFTRMGSTSAHARRLARMFALALRGDTPIADEVRALRRELNAVRYCYDAASAQALAARIDSDDVSYPFEPLSIAHRAMGSAVGP